MRKFKKEKPLVEKEESVDIQEKKEQKYFDNLKFDKDFEAFSDRMSIRLREMEEKLAGIKMPLPVQDNRILNLYKDLKSLYPANVVVDLLRFTPLTKFDELMKKHFG